MPSRCQSMSDIERSSNIREEKAQRAFMSIVPGVIGLVFAIVLFFYATGWTLGLRWVLLAFSVAAIGYGLWQLTEMRKIATYDIICPFCKDKNTFSEEPRHDVRCNHCNRDIPVLDGRMLKVFEVRCGFCSALNWYSEKSTGLICEECDRVIPISTDEGAASAAMSTYARHDDNTPYSLTLIDAGLKREEMIPVLQKMLALNRNQVKKIIEETPMVLLQGVPRKKAELLAAQITAHGGQADASPTS